MMRMMPGMSTGTFSGCRFSSMVHSPRIRVNSRTGIRIMKMNRHPRVWFTMPPYVGPNAGAAAETSAP